MLCVNLHKTLILYCLSYNNMSLHRSRYKFESKYKLYVGNGDQQDHVGLRWIMRWTELYSDFIL